MQSAKYADETNLASINLEFSSIVESLRKKDQYWKDTIPRLCLLLEKRMELNDPSLVSEGFEILSINQISTEISRFFTRKGLKIANHVHDYCPPKYKDGSKIHNNSPDNRAAQWHDEIDQLLGLSNLERSVLDQIDNCSTADLDAIYTFCCNKIKNKVESVARDRKHLLPGHENREGYKTRKPPEKITEYWKAIEWFRDGPLLAFQEHVKQFPPPEDKEQNWINGIYAWGNIYYSIVNLKASLTIVQWISRIKYMIHQSKHGAAVYDLVETEICDNCWDDKLGREREGCNAEMMYDYMSPTNWRCGTCGGYSGRKRGLTREQIGDNKSPTLTKAEEVIHYLLHNYEAHDYYASDTMKLIYERKIKLGVDLSKKS